MKSLIIVLLLFSNVLTAQNSGEFNFGFEKNQTGSKLSDGWFKWGESDLSIDSVNIHSGNFSGKVLGGNSFGVIAYRVPAQYRGSKIRLEAFMKTKDVQQGFAGILLRIDNEDGALKFDNMESQNITGTNDWKKYSIELDYPEAEASRIYIGGILSGNGEAWFDDFNLYFDDVAIDKAQIKETAVSESGHEFDKGSNVLIQNPDESSIENLELLGKIWGFLKYHHPEVAKGNFNWDFELIRILPDYIKIKSTKERDDFLIGWIVNLGEIKEKQTIPVSNDSFLKPDISFVDELSYDLKQKLYYIYENRNQEKNIYFEQGDAGQIKFTAERAYKNMDYPDDGFRYLSVCRYWNMVQYFFPYKYLTDKDWNKVLKEYIPIFLSAENELEYELACLQIIGEIQDTHANIWGSTGNKIEEWKGLNAPPFRTEFTEGRLVVTDYYNPELKDKSGPEIGDVILDINGKKTEEFISEKTKFYPASNHSSMLRDMAYDILKSNEKSVEVRFSNNQNTEIKTVKLYPSDSLNIYYLYKKPNGDSFRIIDGNIGYITLANITKKDIPKIKKHLFNTKGIIIDIRNYPNAFIPRQLGAFFQKDSGVFVKTTKPVLQNPGEFIFTEVDKIPKEKKEYPNKAVVLVNENTQSRAEFTAMALQTAKNSVLIGSQTAGADGNMTFFYLPGGIYTAFSGIGVYYPDGTETQRIGIVPDIEIKPTVEGIRNGKDELLEKAIELILNKKNE